MKQAKKLTRTQKECVEAHGLNWKEWRFIKETEFYYVIINKSKQIKFIDKNVRKKVHIL